MKNLQEGSDSNLPAISGIEVAGLSGATAQAFAQAFCGFAGDVALVVDEGGLILGAATGEASGPEGLARVWQGQPWRDAVATDSLEKVAAILQDLAMKGQARRREINFRVPGRPPLLLACTALRLGTRGPSLVIGRDLRVTAALQERMVEVQQQLERGYWDARRRLFHRDAP